MLHLILRLNIWQSNLGREEKRSEQSAEVQDKDVMEVTEEIRIETMIVPEEITENNVEDSAEEDAIEMIDID